MAWVVVRSARTPSAASMMPNAIAAPTTMAAEIVRPTRSRPIGSMLVLSIATRSSVFISVLPRNQGRQFLQSTMNVDFHARLGDAAVHGCFRDASSLQFHGLDRAPHLLRQLLQKLSHVVGTLRGQAIVLRQYLGVFVKRDVFRRAGPPEIINQLVPGDGVHPWRQRLRGIVGVALDVDGQ